MCKGHCPSTTIDDDWRNRSEYCDVWKGLLQAIEKQMLEKKLTPISLHSHRQQLETFFLNTWAVGHNTSIANALKQNGQNQ